MDEAEWTGLKWIGLERIGLEWIVLDDAEGRVSDSLTAREY